MQFFEQMFSFVQSKAGSSNSVVCPATREQNATRRTSIIISAQPGGDGARKETPKAEKQPKKERLVKKHELIN
jgi:hypothetical protein